MAILPRGPTAVPADARPNMVLVTKTSSSSAAREGQSRQADSREAAPAATPVPPPAPGGGGEPSEGSRAEEGTGRREENATDGRDRVTEPPEYPQPKLRLEVRDLGHAGADLFLKSVHAAAVLRSAVGNVQRLLYGRNFWYADPAAHVPPTRSVTVVLRDMDGVAYTTGSELDDDHKEIHFSLRYIAGITPPDRATAEIAGVLTHELVHCYQWNALGTSPGGLIEGIADWVRLRCGLEPPHWKREPATVGRWDGGYQHTAYFLDYLERRFGDGTVRRINEGLRLRKYEAGAFWPGLLGRPVEALWDDYVDAVRHERPEASSAPGPGEQEKAHE